MEPPCGIGDLAVIEYRTITLFQVLSKTKRLNQMLELQTSQHRWLDKLTTLKKARGNAPHKPLLLLVFLDLVENGEFHEPNLRLTPGLAFRFNTFFSVVQHRRTARPDVRMPFHHLSSGGFWTVHMSNDEHSPHRATTTYVVPNPEFVEACRDATFRYQARCTLIANHFEPAEQNALYHLVGIEIPDADVIARDAFFTSPSDAEQAGRDGRFRLEVVPTYNYTCALTGYRVTTILSGAIVDAAHIHQFANSRNNDLKNGIALCKNAHWQFDAGLWTIDDDYRIVVAKEAFEESSPNQKALAEMHGERVRLPKEESKWPSQVHLEWHRTNKFNKFA
jgi:putative restriction endonuclease